MTFRIFIKFRINQVSKSSTKKIFLVVKATCLKLLSRAFDFEKNFIHAQSEMLQERVRCYVLINCNYRDSRLDLKDAIIHFYHVIKDEVTLLIFYILYQSLSIN